jgi:hypothetical protein
MTAQDQQIRFDAGRHLDNDVPRIARAQDGGDLQALGVERRHVGVQFLDHEGIGPSLQLILLSAGNLRRKIPYGEGGIVIDTQHMELVRGALGQCCGHVAGGQGMGTVAIPLLEGGG